jgi:hypothetical protein
VESSHRVKETRQLPWAPDHLLLYLPPLTECTSRLLDTGKPFRLVVLGLTDRHVDASTVPSINQGINQATLPAWEASLCARVTRAINGLPRSNLMRQCQLQGIMVLYQFVRRWVGGTD